MLVYMYYAGTTLLSPPKSLSTTAHSPLQNLMLYCCYCQTSPNTFEQGSLLNAFYSILCNTSPCFFIGFLPELVLSHLTCTSSQTPLRFNYIFPTDLSYKHFGRKLVHRAVIYHLHAFLHKYSNFHPYTQC